MKKLVRITRSRRDMLTAASAAFTGIAMIPAAAKAAQFSYKYGHDGSVDNPMHVRAVEMANAVKRETNGRLEIQIFPDSQLGSDPSMMTQVRQGAIQFSCQSGSLFSSVVPVASMQTIPFAFKSTKDAIAAHHDEWGAAIRREMELKAGIHVFPSILVNGFRQITSGAKPIRTPDDLAGFKVRTPPGTIYVEVYRAWGAQAVGITVGEVYTALQTKIIDGEDETYTFIELGRIYEVQKYLCVVDAMWGGLHFYVNADAWKALPPDIQTVMERQALLYCKRQQADAMALATAYPDKLRRQGMIFTNADRGALRARLESWYPKAKAQYGPAMWAMLEKYSGKLA